MDDVVNRMARELSDAIAAAVAEDSRVEACRERARAAGFEMKLSLEAVIGFVNRTTPGALARIGPVQKTARSTERRNFEISANDKRFLRSISILPVISGDGGIPSSPSMVGATSRSEPSISILPTWASEHRTTGTGLEV